MSRSLPGKGARLVGMGPSVSFFEADRALCFVSAWYRFRRAVWSSSKTQAGSFNSRSLSRNSSSAMSSPVSSEASASAADPSARAFVCGKSGSPSLFLRLLSSSASSSSRLCLLSSAKRRNFSSRLAFFSASSSSNFRFLAARSSRSALISACSAK